jgi:hypothetical protein
MTGHHAILLLANALHLTSYHDIHSLIHKKHSNHHVISKAGHYNASRRTDTCRLFHVVSMETHYGTLSHIPHRTATMKSANHGNKA